MHLDEGPAPLPWRGVPPRLIRAGLAAWLLLGVLGVAAVAVVGLARFSTIVLPIVFGALLAAVFAPITDALRRRGVPGSLAALLTVVGIIALLSLVVTLITRSVLAQGDALAAAGARALTDAQAWLADIGVDGTVIDRIREGLSSIGATGGSGLLTSAAGAATTAAITVVGLFLALVFLFFLLRDGHQLEGWALQHFGPVRGGQAVSAGHAGVITARRYFAGRSVVALVDAVLIGLGAAVLGVPLVPAIAVLTFIGGFVPYIGALVAGALAVALALTNGGFTTALLMLAVVLIVQNVIEPLVEARVIGGSLGLHPMVVIIVTTIGGIAAGLPGLVLAAPLAATVVAVLSQRAQAAPSPVAPAEPDAPSDDAAVEVPTA